MTPSNRSRSQGQLDRHATKLDLFTNEFKSEDELRRVIADLFRKMGHKGVRITHGPNEKGKDIVFYSTGPLGEKRLFACVVKNAPITGQAEDYKNGAPTIVHQLQGVLNQINAAFAEPLPSGRGTDEWIDSVYVITPYECPIATIESVKHTIQRGGQITFKCGQELLELFAEHWPEFLWFESSVLLSYLSVLRKGLEEDYALANLILRKSYFANTPGGLADLYVEPMFYRKLKTHACTAVTLPSIVLLANPLTLFEIEQETRGAKNLARLLETAVTWSTDSQAAIAKTVAHGIIRIAGTMADSWEAGYQKHVAKAIEAARRIGSGHDAHDYSASRLPGDALVGPSRQDVSIAVVVSAKVRDEADQLVHSVNELLAELQSFTRNANHFAQAAHKDQLQALSDPGFLTYSHISDAARMAPFAFESSDRGALHFSESLLAGFTGPLLITGPAGFGKTTFCRWNAMRDASQLVDKEGSILPVYIPLHPLSSGRLGSFEQVFFPSDELRKLIQQQSAGQAPFQRIRLYLDGLDEVTSTARQKQIVDLAEQASSQWHFLQVIVTGRDHVNGFWLRWLRRVRLSPLDDQKVRQLAEKWLGRDRIDAFFARLTESENLADLMRVPLLATLILAVYRKTGTVPPNKVNLYSLFIELLCGGWDVYKNVQRHDNVFSIKDKTVVLTRLAGILQRQNKRDASESEFRTALRTTFSFFMPDSDQMLQEIVEDGLLVRVGRSLTFSHHSFQEFLAARDLHDPDGNRPKQAMSRYFIGEDWWKEVLAFYVSMSERPDEMDEWIAKRALASTITSADIHQRALHLQKALLTAFPAYKERAIAKELYDQVRVKASRITPPEVSSNQQRRR